MCTVILLFLSAYVGEDDKCQPDAATCVMEVSTNMRMHLRRVTILLSHKTINQ